MHSSLLRGRRARRHFTLIELVVVLMILATLAGLVVSQVSSLGRSSDMAATAKNQADLAENLGLFFVLQKRFPQRMDSLLVSDGTAPTGVYVPMEDDGAGGLQAATGESTQLRGLPISGPSLHADLFMGTLTNATNADYAKSFTRCGFDFVMDHDNTAANSNNSGVFERALSGAISVAEVDATAADGDGPSAVAQKLLPGTGGIAPTGTRIIALGVGPRSSCIPKTMLNAPIYPGCDGKYYGRYVAFFMVYATGERATLIGVTDSYGRNPEYSIQQYNESLPDGSRQG
ncbi:MAG: type II secretion system protein [Planctomycetota bacterium]